jgi:hypothetical protein
LVYRSASNQKKNAKCFVALADSDGEEDCEEEGEEEGEAKKNVVPNKCMVVLEEDG